MDVEGAERMILEHAGAWTERVRAIKVEVHKGYTVTDCARDLERLGFEATIDRVHHAAVVGVRRHA
jgi:hypothetical protein